MPSARQRGWLPYEMKSGPPAFLMMQAFRIMQTFRALQDGLVQRHAQMRMGRMRFAA